MPGVQVTTTEKAELIENLEVDRRKVKELLQRVRTEQAETLLIKLEETLTNMITDLEYS